MQTKTNNLSTKNNSASKGVYTGRNGLRWMRLDNAAKIYPAARRRNWSSIFRLSVTLSETVDRAVLKSALDVTVKRFPSIAARLRRGLFWYYLEEIAEAPEISDEKSYPLTNISRAETKKCAFRVIAYKNRIAIEIFHSLTDGTGALIFLKTLTAEYLTQKYKIDIPCENGILSRLEQPRIEELEDSFQKHVGKVAASRSESNAWHISGTPEPKNFTNLTCFRLSANECKSKAHEYGVTVNTLLASALMMALQNLQFKKVHDNKKLKPVKVLLPINLRRIFDSSTLRNFAFYTTPEINPRLGEYTFDEICKIVHHHMALNIDKKVLTTKITANVKSERSMVVRVLPLFIKNIVMKAIFNVVGEKKSCISMSNLGSVKIPEIMQEHVRRFDFILGVQATIPNNCAVISYGDDLYINFVRNIIEPQLEYEFFEVIKSLGLNAEVQTNSQV